MLEIEGKTVCEALEEVVSPERAVLAVIDIENSGFWSKGHEAALKQFRALGLDVATSDELLELWGV